jgi:CHAD domain-containing protein
VSYRLDARETLPQGIRRVVDEQLRDAVEGLRTATGADRDEAVHEARKATKKARAVLRLVRDEIGSSDYRRENRALRDAARKLSGPRDAVVLVGTLDGLTEQVPLARRSLAPLRKVLEERRVAVTARVLDEEDAMTIAAEEIEAVRVRIEDWRVRGDDFSLLAGGLGRTYTRGCDGFVKARKKPTDARVHEARKRVKDLWYHARLLKPIWPGPMGALVDATDELGDMLGEDHDLAVLLDTVDELVAEGADAGAGETAATLAENRRAELRERIWPLGRRVYADKPKPFVRRAGVLYRVWRAETAWLVSPEVAATVRDLLEARRVGGSGADQRPLRARLHEHGLTVSDLEARLPDRDGDPGAAEFDELVAGGRVRVGDSYSPWRPV